jgi:hypothetical protein
MGPEMLPIQVIFGWIEGRRPRGRLRKKEIDAVMVDIGIISELHGKTGIVLEWQTLTQDRQGWREVIGRLIDTHT